MPEVQAPAPEQNNEPRPLTQGEEMVGLSFNPSKNPDVQRLKELAAEMIDITVRVHRERAMPSYLENNVHGEAGRQILSAQMWAVKDVTLGL